MTWETVLHVLLVVGVYLIIDRSSFWYISNTYAQFTGEPIDITYHQVAFPRLLLGLFGCVLLVIARTSELNIGNVSGLILTVLSLATMCWVVVRRYWNGKDSGQ